jgi:hypothetical protein
MKIVLSGNPINQTEILKKMLDKASKPLNGEVISTELGTYIYRDGEYIPFPQFCATCEFNDNGKCKKLHSCFGDRLDVTDDFYCAFHRVRGMT